MGYAMGRRATRSRADEVAEAIDRSREDMFNAFNALDLDAFMSRIADDAIFMDHGGPPPLVGKEAIRSAYKAFFDRMTPNLIPSSDEIVVSGEWAFDRGTWRSIKSDKRGVPRQRLESCYVMIWRWRSVGGWKLARSIWNGADVTLSGTDVEKESGKRKQGGQRRR